MSSEIHVISSMATRRLLAELVARFEAMSTQAVSLESVGGVDAAARVAAGEPFDAVILAAEAIEALIAKDRVLAGSRVDLVHSEIAMAVRAGTPHHDVDTEDAVRRAVLAARSVGYSTGPSGSYLVDLFKRWNIAAGWQGRLVKAPAGTPVGSLVASGEIDLGFQQLSELIHVPGIEVIGTLPAAIRHVTTFSAGIAHTSTEPERVRALLAFLAAPEADAIKRQNGMEPA